MQITHTDNYKGKPTQSIFKLTQTEKKRIFIGLLRNERRCTTYYIANKCDSRISNPSFLVSMSLNKLVNKNKQTRKVRFRKNLAP